MAVRLIRKIVRILFSKPVRAIFPFLIIKYAHSFPFRFEFPRRAQNVDFDFSFFSNSSLEFLPFAEEKFAFDHTLRHHTVIGLLCANDRDGE